MSKPMREAFELPEDSIDLEAAEEIKEANDKETEKHFTEIIDAIEDSNEEALELREGLEDAEAIQLIWDQVNELARTDAKELAYNEYLDVALRDIEFATNQDNIEEDLATIEAWAENIEAAGYLDIANNVFKAIDALKLAKLDEALPADLAKAYKATQFVIGDDPHGSTLGYAGISRTYIRPSVDFQNSEYTKITADDAKALYKAKDLENLRIVFAGQLVMYNNDRKQIRKAMAAKANYEDRKKFIHADKVVDQTTKMSFAEIVDNAEAIYKATEQPIPQDVIDARADTPESRYTKDLPRIETPSGKQMRGAPGTKPYSYYDDYDVRNMKKRIAAVKELLAADPTGPMSDYYKRDIADREARLAETEKKIAAVQQYQRDRAAYLRYYKANSALAEPIKKFKALKSEAENNKYNLDRAVKKLQELQDNGVKARRLAEIEKIKRQIRELNLKIAEAEEWLPVDEETDKASTKVFTDSVAELEAAQSNIQAQIDELLGR